MKTVYELDNIVLTMKLKKPGRDVRWEAIMNKTSDKEIMNSFEPSGKKSLVPIDHAELNKHATIKLLKSKLRRVVTNVFSRLLGSRKMKESRSASEMSKKFLQCSCCTLNPEENEPDLLGGSQHNTQDGDWILLLSEHHRKFQLECGVRKHRESIELERPFYKYPSLEDVGDCPKFTNSLRKANRIKSKYPKVFFFKEQTRSTCNRLKQASSEPKLTLSAGPQNDRYWIN